MKFFRRSNSLLSLEKNKLLKAADKAFTNDDIIVKFCVSFLFIRLDLTVIQKYKLVQSASRVLLLN